MSLPQTPRKVERKNDPAPCGHGRRGWVQRQVSTEPRRVLHILEDARNPSDRAFHTHVRAGHKRSQEKRRASTPGHEPASVKPPPRRSGRRPPGAAALTSGPHRPNLPPSRRRGFRLPHERRRLPLPTVAPAPRGPLRAHHGLRVLEARPRSGRGGLPSLLPLEPVPRGLHGGGGARLRGRLPLEPAGRRGGRRVPPVPAGGRRRAAVRSGVRRVPEPARVLAGRGRGPGRHRGLSVPAAGAGGGADPPVPDRRVRPPQHDQLPDPGGDEGGARLPRGGAGAGPGARVRAAPRPERGRGDRREPRRLRRRMQRHVERPRRAPVRHPGARHPRA